ncbi:unnamed protein product [Rotaria sordida]|uniref:Reverse transcriptase domain-containing protein n=1 Tax=Rotaria sordida TaxID=392033 RepID=A0A815TTS0_9BILA|nr:unnamed protein product [Rotaria sordida]CAF1510532.1 unnamed protein product [Rotaria sordida]
MANQVNDVDDNENNTNNEVNVLEEEEDDNEIDYHQFPIEDLNDSDGDDDDEWSLSNSELSHHHYEPQCLKNLDWKDFDDCIRTIDKEYSNEDERKDDFNVRQQMLILRRKSIEDNIILRAAYKAPGVYIFSAKKFQKKSLDFMLQTGAYLCVQELDDDEEKQKHVSQEYLASIVHRVETTLKNLLDSKSISEVQYTMMNVNRSLVRLNYLYFVPSADEMDITLHPIMVCNDGPTMNIACYLNRLLGPIFNQVTHCTQFSKGIDVIHALEFYQKKGTLQPTTLFIKFNIDKLCITFFHEQVIEALKYFLDHYTSNHDLIHGMTNHTIIELVRLVLENQFFIYDNKLYQQMKGSASGSALTFSLVYIYLFYWRPDLMHIFINPNELFGRYRDEAFITYNRSEDELETLLHTAATQFHLPSFQNILSLDITTSFMDVTFDCDDGILHTRVHHESDSGCIPYSSFPSVTERPIHDKSKWLRKVFYRAVRYCSNLFYWYPDHRFTQFLFEKNHLSKDFFNQVYEQFANDFGIFKANQRFGAEHAHEIIRQKLFRYDKFLVELNKKQQKPKETLCHPVPLTVTKSNPSSILPDPDKEYNKQLYKDSYDPTRQLEDVWFKRIKYASFNLTANDVLVNKRPPIHLLTLSEDKNKH